MSKSRLQLKYNILQGNFWITFGITLSFINSYLAGIGLDAQVIGLIIAVFSGLAAIAQLFLGKLADRHRKVIWKDILIILIVLRILVNAFLFFVESANLSGFLFGLMVFLLNAMIPFVNSATFYYEKSNIELSFGFARGVGSLFFAVGTFFVGRWVSNFGISVILYTGMIANILLLLSAFSMPIFSKEKTQVDLLNEPKHSGNLFKQYPKFVFTLFAFVLLMSFHSNTNTYLLDIFENVGGNNADLGVALAVAALLEIPIMLGFNYVRKIFKSHQMLVISGLAFLVKGLVYYFASSTTGIYAAQLTQIFCFSLFASASVYYAREQMPLSRLQQGQSLAASTITIGSVFGNLIGGRLIYNYGIKTNIFVMNVLVVIAIIIVILMKNPPKKENEVLLEQ